MDFDNIHIPENITSVKINNEKMKNINFIKKYDKEWDELDFEHNDFEELKIISNIKCNKLILNNNNIKEITIFECNIKCLEMEKCNLEKIHFINTNIEKLILNNNSIEEINLFPNNLKHLEVKKNSLSYFHYNEVLSKLEILYLDNNNIENFVFDKNNELIKLSLNNNSLSCFDMNIITQKLKLLNLLNNCFDFNEYEYLNILKIRQKYENLKLFIENFTDNNDSSSSDENMSNSLISKKKIKFFNDSDNSDNTDNSDNDNNGDNDFSNKDIDEYVIIDKSKMLNNKDKVEFRWNISI